MIHSHSWYDCDDKTTVVTSSKRNAMQWRKDEVINISLNGVAKDKTDRAKRNG